MLRLLILLFLYFKPFVVLWYVRHSEGFFEGATPFLIHLGSKLMYMVRLYVLTFLLYPFYGFWTFFFLLLSSYSSLHVSLLFLLFLYLNCLNSFCLFLFIILCPQTPVLPIAASLILSVNNIKKKPCRKYHVPRPSHRNAASLILPALLMRKPRENPSLRKKSAKVNHCLYSSTEQLQVALWTFMFIRFGLYNEKSLHTLPLQSLHLLSLHLYPSLSKPSVLSPWSVWLLKHKEYLSVPQIWQEYDRTTGRNMTGRKTDRGP